jgi:hypothetical protein
VQHERRDQRTEIVLDLLADSRGTRVSGGGVDVANLASEQTITD